MNSCEYKQTIRGDAADKIYRKYKRLTNKEPPPVDTVKFIRDQRVHVRSYKFSDKIINIENGLDVSKIYHFSEDPVGILISVSSYVKGGGGHAISAVKYGKTLYAFNAWGKTRQRIDTKIFNTICGMYKCTSVTMYNGPSLQLKNTASMGVCVGFASNYIMEMFLKIAAGRVPRKSQFDNFVFTALSERGICFGTRCENNIKLGSVQKIEKMYKNLMRPVVTPTNVSKLDTMRVNNLRKLAAHFNVNHQGLRKPAIRNKLKQYFTQEPIKFRSISVSRKKKVPVAHTNEGFRTLADVQAYARSRCIKGRSLHRRKSDLIAHVRAHNRSPPKPMSNSNIAGLRAQNLRDYARDRCIPGYSRYTKKEDLKKYLIAKKYVRK